MRLGGLQKLDYDSGFDNWIELIRLYIWAQGRDGMFRDSWPSAETNPCGVATTCLPSDILHRPRDDMPSIITKRPTINEEAATLNEDRPHTRDSVHGVEWEEMETQTNPERYNQEK